MVTFAALDKRCSVLLGAPTQVTVSGLCNTQMNGVYVLEDELNGRPHWVNRASCRCDNCAGSACHLYLAVETPAVHWCVMMMGP